MSLSILVVRALALAYIAAGIGALSGKIVLSQIMDEFERSVALSFITGFITLVMGVLLVGNHNLWVKDWRVVVTIVGWAMIIKGFLFIAWPQFLSLFKSWYKNSRVLGTLILIIGLALGYLGFLA